MDEMKFSDKKEMQSYVRDLMTAFDEMGTPLKEIIVLEYHEADCKSEPCECILAYGVDLNQTLEF